MADASNTTAPTQFIQTKLEKYAYRRFGKVSGLPLLCLHSTDHRPIGLAGSRLELRAERESLLQMFDENANSGG
jgi:hypothetical protein